jgi:hypothetical protein
MKRFNSIVFVYYSYVSAHEESKTKSKIHFMTAEKNNHFMSAMGENMAVYTVF